MPLVEEPLFRPGTYRRDDKVAFLEHPQIPLGRLLPTHRERPDRHDVRESSSQLDGERFGFPNQQRIHAQFVSPDVRTAQLVRIDHHKTAEPGRNKVGGDRTSDRTTS